MKQLGYVEDKRQALYIFHGLHRVLHGKGTSDMAGGFNWWSQHTVRTFQLVFEKAMSCEVSH